MNEDRALVLFSALTDIREEYIEEALPTEKKRRRPDIRVLAPVAACLCIVIALAFILTHQGAPGLPGGSGDGGGGKDSDIYAYYAGPVLPMTASEGGEGLTVERRVNYDFSPFDPNWERDKENHLRFHETCIVTDDYLLAAPDGEERTVTLLYPFVASLYESKALLPNITVNGEAAETEMLIGPGSTERNAGTTLSSWESCKTLMAGDYAAEAQAPLPRLTDRVIVYELSEMWGESSETAPAPTLNMEFSMDYAKTAILTFGFNGGRSDREAGRCERQVFIAEHGEMGYGRSVYLLVLGEDIRDLTLQGYTNGACEIPMEAGGTVTRYEAALEEMLDLAFDSYRAEFIIGGLASLTDRETLLGLAAAYMLRHNAVEGSAVPYEQSQVWSLEDMLEQVFSPTRVLYLRFTLTSPAGETAEVEARLPKYPSVDFTGRERDRRGFDLATGLGSILTFTKQEAGLSGTQYIRILRQNFGFDPQKGVLQVTLDPMEEHYYMDVEAKRQN